MICPTCSSDRVNIELIQATGKSSHRSVGFGGHTNNFARGMTALSTAGMSNLFWKKSQGGSKTKFKNQKLGICQDCGHSWKIK